MSDVVVTEQLFAKLNHVSMFAQAVVRGSYAAEVGRMGWRGLPADLAAYQRLCEQYKNVLVQYRRAWDAEGVRLTPRGSIRASWWEQKLESWVERNAARVPKRGRPVRRESMCCG